jgi:hypothetical protein
MGTGCEILFNGCTRGLPQLIFMTTIQERGPWNHKGSGNGQTQLMETNTLKLCIPTMIVTQQRKMDGNRLWNPIQRVYKGVATIYFHDNYPGTWSMNHKGPGNGQTPLMETNTLRIGIPTMIVAQKRKMDGTGLWNHIERVYKAVAKT